MARRYTEEDKQHALQTLDDNFGDVTLTALQTDIPRRTLQDWKRMRKLKQKQTGEHLPPKKDDAQQQQYRANHQDKEHKQVYTEIRDRLLDHIYALVDVLIDDPEIMHARVMSLIRLLDRVIKLEALSDNEQVEHRVIIEYKHPDGTLHKNPHWFESENGEDWNPFGWREDMENNQT